MAGKCKKGYKKVGKACVTNKAFKKFGKFADEVSVLKLTLIGVISSVGGWSVFRGLTEITGMDTMNPWLSIVVGFGIILLAYKFGFAKK